MFIIEGKKFWWIKKTAIVTFTERELQYLTGQRLDMIATVSLHIQPPPCIYASVTGLVTS